MIRSTAIVLACFATTILSGTAASAADGEVAAEMIASIERRTTAAVSLLERIVNVNSGTMNFAGVRTVARLLEPEFTALGFTTRWVEGNAFDRSGHLIATRPGSGPKIVLIGHLDTVFEPDSPLQRFERLDGNLARGPGVTDMKGGIVVMLEALRALGEVRGLGAFDFAVVLHGDEEDPGTPLDRARQDLIALARDAQVAIGFEDGDGRLETAVIARRGASSWRLETLGRPAHSSLIFADGIGFGAIYEMARILSEFREALAGEPYLTFNPGLVLGGTTVDFDAAQLRGRTAGKDNVIAERSVVSGDLRTLSPEQLVQARATMREIVARHLPGTTAEIDFLESYPPMAPTDGNRRLLTMLDAASRDLGYGAVTAVDPRDAGAADISFVAARVDMAIDGVGLSGTGGHTLEETADLSALPIQAARVALLLHRLAP